MEKSRGWQAVGPAYLRRNCDIRFRAAPSQQFLDKTKNANTEEGDEAPPPCTPDFL